jgi:hypothetical protein
MLNIIIDATIKQRVEEVCYFTAFFLDTMSKFGLVTCLTFFSFLRAMAPV